MRTVSYEVFQGPQTVTIIPPGPQPHSEHVYAQFPRRRAFGQSRDYAIDGPVILPRTNNHVDQDPYTHRLNEAEEKYTIRTESPTRGRTLARTIKVVSSSRSPARAPSPHPRGILRSSGSDTSGRRLDVIGTKSARLNDASTASVVGTASVLVPTDRISRASSTSSYSGSASSRKVLSSMTSPSSQTYARSDYSSFARTSSHQGIFHFAYGTHISPSQLRSRLRHNSASPEPIALARISNFIWYINARGVANIASCPPHEVKPAQTDADVVWGLLYNLDPDDESELDYLHGWDALATGGRNYNAHEIKGRPWYQGEQNRTNKMFLMIEAVEWFVDPRKFGLPSEIWHGDKVRATVYVDELNVKPGRIRNELITSMSDAIASGISYGIPRSWADNVMRVYGIEPRKHHRQHTQVEHSFYEGYPQMSRRQLSPYRSVIGEIPGRRRRRDSIEMVEEINEQGTRTKDDTNERIVVVRKRRSREFY